MKDDHRPKMSHYITLTLNPYNQIMSSFGSHFLSRARDLRNSYFSCPEQYILSEEYFRMLKQIADTQLSNFHIPQEFPSVSTQGRIYASEDMRISIYFIPQGTRIPLHDHPTMHVISKILKGRIDCDCYQLQDPSHQVTKPKEYLKSLEDTIPVEFPLLIATKSSHDLTSGDVVCLTPENNLHTMYAREDCIFLDVICPDYDRVDKFLNLYEEVEGEVSGETGVMLRMKPPNLKWLPVVNVQFR